MRRAEVVVGAVVVGGLRVIVLVTTLASLLRCSRSRWYVLLPGAVFNFSVLGIVGQQVDIKRIIRDSYLFEVD